MRTSGMLFFAITGFIMIRCGSGPEKPAEPVMKLVWSNEVGYAGLPDSARWTYDVAGDAGAITSCRGTWPAIWMLAGTNPPAWPDDGETTTPAKMPEFRVSSLKFKV